MDIAMSLSQQKMPLESTRVGIHLRALTKSSNLEYRETMDFTNGSIARNCSCFTSGNPAVVGGLRLLELIWADSSTVSPSLTLGSSVGIIFRVTMLPGRDVQ